MKQLLGLSNNTAKLHSMFGKKLYSNKYSFIAEICQNAVDSHRMSRQDKPVTVGLTGSRFYIRDYGLSFTSKEDFIKKVCTILESGKSSEKTSSEDCPMGMHGIGTISVSAYNSTWQYRVYMEDGREFDCTLEEVEGKGLTYQISDYRSTSVKEKGTLFSVGIVPGTLDYLVEAMKEKLAYFKDIKFEFASEIVNRYRNLLTLNTEFKLYQSEDFQISTLNKNDEMHISLDQYAYRIRWDILKIQPVKVPIALKFTMGDGLEADLTRENLIHDENYKKIVSEKIKKVCDQLVQKYNEIEKTPYKDIEKFLTAYVQEKTLFIGDRRIILTTVFNNSDILPVVVQLEGVSDSSLAATYCKNSNYGKSLFKLNSEISRSGARTKNPIVYRSFTHAHHFLEDVEITSKNVGYLKATFPDSGYYSLKKLKAFKGADSYRSILGLQYLKEYKTHYKKTGINQIPLIRKDIEALINHTETKYLKKLSSITIPVIKRTRTVREKKDDEYCINLGRVSKSGDSPVYEANWVKQSDIPSKGNIVFGKKDDKIRLSVLYSVCQPTSAWGSKVKPVLNVGTVTDKVYKSLEDLKIKSCMTLDEFLKGHSKPFEELVTGIKVAEFLDKWRGIFAYSKEIEACISPAMGVKMKALLSYSSKVNMHECLHLLKSSNSFLKSITTLGETLSLFDKSIKADYDYVSEEISKFDFVTVIPILEFSKKSTQLMKMIEDVIKQREIKE